MRDRAGRAGRLHVAVTLQARAWRRRNPLRTPTRLDRARAVVDGGRNAACEVPCEPARRPRDRDARFSDRRRLCPRAGGIAPPRARACAHGQGRARARVCRSARRPPPRATAARFQARAGARRGRRCPRALVRRPPRRSSRARAERQAARRSRAPTATRTRWPGTYALGRPRADARSGADAADSRSIAPGAIRRGSCDHRQAPRRGASAAGGGRSRRGDHPRGGDRGHRAERAARHHLSSRGRQRGRGQARGPRRRANGVGTPGGGATPPRPGKPLSDRPR